MNVRTRTLGRRWDTPKKCSLCSEILSSEVYSNLKEPHNKNYPTLPQHTSHLTQRQTASKFLYLPLTKRNRRQIPTKLFKNHKPAEKIQFPTPPTRTTTQQICTQDLINPLHTPRRSKRPKSPKKVIRR